MKNYCALVNNSIVSEIIVADFDWVENNLQGDWHDLGAEPLTIAVGWIYDSVDNQFIEPVVEEIIPPVIDESVES